MINWLLDSGHWLNDDGLLVLIFQHLIYSIEALFIAVIIAFPIGCYVGHTGKGAMLLIGSANAMRALPSFGLIILLVILFGPVFESDLAFIVPCLIVLIILALPPIMMGVYSGIRAINPAIIDAATGMGYSPLKLLLTVEIPCAMALILSGIRSSALQIVSTATIAAYVSLGGLGRLIIDGRAQNDYPQMVAGAFMVGILALLVDVFFSFLIRFIVSPGLRQRERRRKKTIPLSNN
ncbi:MULTISPECIES: ABC transporter permease [Rahnella]|jgi:osmoprotectant transport system permease protein|uniref:ABC transporter permease n=1 Tax=Rahnella sp. (strain Y9602) TaxID=2703885 RepID=A0ABW6C963_RAHSY|nr:MULTISPECIES: ABC transporter permease [Rahnella]AFE58617.1 binding-protein-dependent transport system inner membrane protein [Rahnella aquatilis HX2]AYA07264.1 ABC transporter permease [Rahnella aquatilis]AZP42470.1 ABC transporter permease [Rahnella aquatilis]AZP46810.1 ABC transporter permease [Rahnella aquatilis]AZP51201.1 ABC transporter permease [Rahnella aquatilis]